MIQWKIPVRMSDGNWKLYVVETNRASRVGALYKAAAQARLDENNGKGRRSRMMKGKRSAQVGLDDNNLLS
jgi:hypothetical protein